MPFERHILLRNSYHLHYNRYALFTVCNLYLEEFNPHSKDYAKVFVYTDKEAVNALSVIYMLHYVRIDE